MGFLAGGGSGGGGLLGGGNGGGGLLGSLPDPLGIGKLLFGDHGPQGGGMPQQPGPPMPSGVNFAQQPPPSAASFNPGQAFTSPMGPTGFGIGGGRR
jgi:hypothetical protein